MSTLTRLMGPLLGVMGRVCDRGGMNGTGGGA